MIIETSVELMSKAVSKDNLDENNKAIIDRLHGILKNLHKLTYIELGILLGNLDFDTEWVSLGEAHDYLGGYENGERDKLTKLVLDIDIFHPTKEQATAIAENDLRILNLAKGKSMPKKQ